MTELSDGSLPLRHAYYLATFPPEVQQKIVERTYAYKWQDKTEGAATFDEFKEIVEENIVRNLATAPFDKNDPGLHVKGLICSKCPQQTGFNLKLYEDDFKDEKCLNETCFTLKTNVYAKHQQQELAEEIIATKIPDEDAEETPEIIFEEVLKSVPLVTENPTVNKKDLAVKGTVLTNQIIFDEPQCEYSTRSLVVDGANKNQKKYFCASDECPVHHPENIVPEEKSGPTDYELQQTEKRSRIEAAIKTREKVFAKSIEFFTGSNSFWQYADLVEKLLVEIVSLRFSSLIYIEDIFKNWKNFPKNNNREAIEKFIAGLDARRKDQLLFLCVFAAEGFMLSSVGEYRSQEVIQNLAESYAKLNYAVIEAEARLELAPEEFKDLANLNLQHVKNGRLDEVKNFWWNEPKQTE